MVPSNSHGYEVLPSTGKNTNRFDKSKHLTVFDIMLLFHVVETETRNTKSTTSSTSIRWRSWLFFVFFICAPFCLLMIGIDLDLLKLYMEKLQDARTLKLVDFPTFGCATWPDVLSNEMLWILVGWHKGSMTRQRGGENAEGSQTLRVASCSWLSLNVTTVNLTCSTAKPRASIGKTNTNDIKHTLNIFERESFCVCL